MFVAALVWPAEKFGLKGDAAAKFSLCVTASGFVVAHVIKIGLPAPGRILDRPQMLVPWKGIASFGGLLGRAGMRVGSPSFRRPTRSWLAGPYPRRAALLSGLLELRFVLRLAALFRVLE